MKQISKKLKVAVIASVLAVVLAVGFALYYTLPFWVYKTTDTNVSYDREKKEMTVSSNSLKILQITDLHVNGALDMPMTFAIVKNLVYKTQPDLLVLTGDVFSNGCDEQDVKQCITFFEQLNLPWATVLGNHDDETPYSMQKLSEIFENAKNSLFQTGNLSNLYGNYYYHVKFADEKQIQFIFMDSRCDGFTEESVLFYEQAVESSKTVNGGEALQNFLFYHIPPPELNAAIREYEKDASIGSGEIRETACPQSNSVGFFDKVLELSKTKAMIYGHDHVNNVKIRYCGVDFCYGTKSSTSAYNHIGLVGGTVYTLQSNGTYAYNDVIVY